MKILPRPIQFRLSSITSPTKCLLHEGSSFEIIEYDCHLQILLLLFHSLIVSVPEPCFINTILYQNSFALSVFHQIIFYDLLLFTFSSSLFFSLSFLHFLSQYILCFRIVLYVAPNFLLFFPSLYFFISCSFLYLYAFLSPTFSFHFSKSNFFSFSICRTFLKF